MSRSVSVYPAMALLNSFQRQFLTLLDKPDPAGSEPLSFRHNLQQTLMQALNEIYGACRSLLGDDLFEDLVNQYLRSFPPSIHRLDSFPAQLSAFVSGFAPVLHITQLEALARLEWAIYQASICAVDSRFDQVEFQQLRQQQPEQLRLHCATGLALVQADYAVDLLWQHHQQALGAAGLRYLDHGEVKLVVSVRDGKLQVERVNAEGWALLQQLQQQGRYQQLSPELRQAPLQWAIERGWISHFSLQHDAPTDAVLEVAVEAG